MNTRAGFAADPPRVHCAAPACGVELLASRASAAAWSESSQPWHCGNHDMTRRCPDCGAPVTVRAGLVRFAQLSWCAHLPRPTHTRRTLIALPDYPDPIDAD